MEDKQKNSKWKMNQKLKVEYDEEKNQNGR